MVITMSKPSHETINESSEARLSLIKAAATLFAENGYSATGVQQITDAAGVNKAMLYYYFMSKEGIYNVLINEGIRIIEHAVSIAEHATGVVEERLRIFLKTYLTTAEENPELARIIFREAFGECESARQVVADNFKDNVRRLAELISAAQARGELRPDIDPVYSAYSLFGNANMFITRLVVNRQPIDVAPLVDHILSIFMRGMISEKNQPEDSIQ